ncbi:MAG TPA: alpha/beta fold hydrolase [Flavihumibacter sp.]|nr:alpha/beta fold hydrolase [Flavihumibacter sp.]
MHSRRRKGLRKITFLVLTVFLLLNGVAYIHAYKFTHFAAPGTSKTANPQELSFVEKLKVLALGVSNPRPENKILPRSPFETIVLQSNVTIEGWYLKHRDSSVPAKGVVLICHGYGGEKSSMLDKAAIFDSLQYDCLLIDFMGSGGSAGNTTTIGFKEAEEVKTAYEYLVQRDGLPVYLFGTSMGAAAILKAANDYQLHPAGIMIECPFGSMYETVSARFKNMHAPIFPMARLLVFWGGVQNGFWAFGHNPADYAKAITVPTLLLWGERDKNVSYAETQAIFSHLAGPKQLKTYPLAGHENYLIKYRSAWSSDISQFLQMPSQQLKQ